MPSYEKVYYCKDCKKIVTTDNKDRCKICGGGKFNITWSIRFRTIENGREIQKRLSGEPTKKSIHDKYLAYMANKKESSLTPLKEEDYSFNTLLGKYFLYCENMNADSTNYEKPKAFALHIQPFFNNCYVPDITKAMLSDWQNYMLKKKNEKTDTSYSWAYRKKLRNYLSGFLSYCEAVYNIPNQLKNVKAPRNQDKKKEIIFWEIEEFQNFINSINDGFWKTMWTTLMFTGARINELRALSDNDLTDITLINKAMAGKKSKEIYSNTKNRKVIEKQTPKLLQVAIAKYKESKRKMNIPSTFLFGGNFPTSENKIRKRLNDDIENYNEKHDIKLKRITPHGFRHSYVSYLIHLGVGTKVIAELIGDTEEQVIKTYGHLYKDAKNKAISILDSSLEQLKLT